MLIIDTDIVPIVQAQQIAWAQAGDSKVTPPHLSDAIADFDKWLESDEYEKMSPEQRERMTVWGLHG